MSNILIAYYSWAGGVRKIAGQLQQLTQGTLFEIQPQVPYPEGYDTVVEQAKEEIKQNFLPPLKNDVESIALYDTVLIGSPNWWSTIAPPVSAFLSGHDLSGKTVVPFCSHGGGGKARLFDTIAALCPTATIKDGIAVYSGEISEQELTAWLKNTGV